MISDIPFPIRTKVRGSWALQLSQRRGDFFLAVSTIIQKERNFENHSLLFVCCMFASKAANYLGTYQNNPPCPMPKLNPLTVIFTNTSCAFSLAIVKNMFESK